MSREDFQFLHNQLVIPLNRAIENAARTHGWTYLRGAIERSRNHGICVTQKFYFNTPGMSDDTQGDFFGSPTLRGHREIYQPIVYQALESYVLEKRRATAKEVAREAVREAARREIWASNSSAHRWRHRLEMGKSRIERSISCKFGDTISVFL